MQPDLNALIKKLTPHCNEKLHSGRK